MTAFQEAFLVDASQSDKLRHHGYHRFYPWFLAHLRQARVTMLEIGIDQTKSLKLWSGYFDDLDLHGIDIDEKTFDGDAVTLHQVDQSDPAQLDAFVDRIGLSFDVILDDGSHIPDHQLLTLQKLWPILKPGGVYIIEDIETSYWGKSRLYGYRFNARRRNLIAPFRRVIDVINAEFSKARPAPGPLSLVAGEIEMMTFGSNCIILVKKDPARFGAFYDRSYRYDRLIEFRSLWNLPRRIARKLRGARPAPDEA